MTPKISILLASYGPQSQKYLDLCFKSLEAQSFQDFEVIHVSSGDYEPQMKWGTDDKHYHSWPRLHFPAAVAKAHELSNPKSEFIMLLNDDVILTKHCVSQLYTAARSGPFLVNPASNCDDNGRFYWRYFDKFSKLQYRIEEMEQIYHAVVDFVPDQNFLLVKQPQVHFYCTMMQRRIWDVVGGIDANLKTGFDDADFCLRAQEFGVVPVIAMHAYALHGSGVSADLHLSQEDRAFNQKYFIEKHKMTVDGTGQGQDNKGSSSSP